MIPVPFIKRSLLAWLGMLKKAFLNATLSQWQTLRENCLLWTVTEGRWKIQQGPRWQGFSLPISSKSTAKNNTIVMPRTSVLTQALGSSHNAEFVKISSEPESKGSFTAIQKSLLGSSAGLGGHGARWSKISEPLLCMHEPPHLFHFFLHRHPWRFTDKPCAQGQEKYQSRTRTWSHMQTNWKMDVAESNSFKLKSFLEEGKEF